LTPTGRFHLHELLRQFAEEKLLALPQELVQAQEHHCLYYLALLQQQEDHLKGRHQASAVAVIEAEIENIRTAWQWAIAHQKIDAIDGCLDSLHVFYLITSWFQEGASTFGQAAEALATDVPTGGQGILFGKILSRQGNLLGSLISHVGSAGSLEKSAEAISQQSLAILTQLGAQEETGLALASEAGILRDLGKYDDALQLLDQALAIFTRQGDHWGMSRMLHDLGFVSYSAGNYHKALQFFQEGSALCEATGNLKTLGDILNMVGDAHKMLGDYAAGRRATEAALAARTTAGDKRGIAWSLQMLGELAWHMGDYELAERRSQESLLLFQAIGLTRTASAALNILGEIASSRGDYQRAKVYFRASLASYLATDTLASFWVADAALAGLGAVLIKEGKASQAAELLTHVLHRPSALHETRQRVSALLSELAGQLPPETLAAAQARAETQALPTLLTELLDEEPRSRAPS
jgi:tetratricopeptide (TPR) repeat protein